MTNLVVGFAGKAGSGKTTAARSLALHGFSTVSFADPLRSLVWVLDPLLEEDKHLTDIAPTVIDFETHKFLKHMYPEYRRVLQNLGTGVVRDRVSHDYFIRSFVTHVMSTPGMYVSDDVRFPNEKDAVEKDCMGVVINIVRKDNPVPSMSHESETALDNTKFTHVIENNGSVDDLHAQVWDYVKGLL